MCAFFSRKYCNLCIYTSKRKRQYRIVLIIDVAKILFQILTLISIEMKKKLKNGLVNDLYSSGKPSDWMF